LITTIAPQSTSNLAVANPIPEAPPQTSTRVPPSLNIQRSLAACAGLGVLVGVDWLVGREFETGELVRVLPQWSMDEDSKIYLLRPAARFTAGKTKVFLSWMVKQFSPLPWRETQIG
jgi:DNA-binding transcriptional LysR family regulator